MGNINVLRDFNIIYQKFNEKSATLEEIETLLSLVRKHKGNLSDEQIISILEIPQNVIREDIELNNPLKQSGSYFSKNIRNPKKAKFLGDLATKFGQNEIYKDDVADLIAYCQKEIDSERNELEFYLRVPEVILGFGNSILKNEDGFRKAQYVFARILKKQLGL